jgi:hypothetical protein
MYIILRNDRSRGQPRSTDLSLMIQSSQTVAAYVHGYGQRIKNVAVLEKAACKERDRTVCLHMRVCVQTQPNSTKPGTGQTGHLVAHVYRQDLY